jgi:CheY-like chemotaxis protein
MIIYHAEERATLLDESEISLPKEVWIIDDDEVDLFTIRKMFEYFIPNCTLVLFQSAKQALEQFKKTPTATVILLDLNLPGFNGWDFLHAVNGSPFIKPIYILTSSSSENDELKSREFQVHGYLYKPLTKEALQFINETHGLSE